ncbi:MAG: ABC transporter substrate-binding protein [Oscillospiraceae bacterium]|nr:ABC transporter substrate-binding protein [Oscillospiraceae bacterium]
MKKILAIILAALMLLSMAACGSSGETEPATDAPTDAATEPAAESTEAPAVHYNVGICQLVTHDALDAATQGFQDALVAILGEDAVSFDLQNAAGDSNTCASIANAFVAAEVDLIMANATPALQACATATGDIPVLGTSVTEYGVAMGIQDFNGTVGGNVSGTSDLAPLTEQAAMLNEWFPDAETVGLLYCSGEANSKYQVDTVKALLEEMGYTCELFAFVDSNDMPAVTQAACEYSDVIYVPTDNAVASGTDVIDAICRPAGVPIIAGEEGICSGCGVATLSISYYDLGYATGEMAAKILTGEADISTMPVGYAAAVTPKYNAEICEDLGLTAPEGYVAIG